MYLFPISGFITDFVIMPRSISALHIVSCSGMGFWVNSVWILSETFPAREKAIRKAKLNILCVCNYNYNRSPAMEMVFDYFIKKEKLENYIEVNSGGAQEENKNG